jgi:hypothetical protein
VLREIEVLVLVDQLLHKRIKPNREIVPGHRWLARALALKSLDNVVSEPTRYCAFRGLLGTIRPR